MKAFNCSLLRVALQPHLMWHWRRIQGHISALKVYLEDSSTGEWVCFSNCTYKSCEVVGFQRKIPQRVFSRSWIALVTTPVSVLIDYQWWLRTLAWEGFWRSVVKCHNWLVMPNMDMKQGHSNTWIRRLSSPSPESPFLLVQTWPLLITFTP